MSQILLNALIAGSIYVLVSVGFFLIYTTSRFFHFAHGAVYTLGAYIALLLSINLGLDRLIAFPLACVATAFVGASAQVLIYRPMQMRKSTSLTLLLASLGQYVVMQNIISLIWGEDIKTLRTGEAVEGHLLIGARITDTQIAIVGASVTLMLLVTLLLYRTRFGRALRAVSNDRELASLSGIDDQKYILCAFALASFLAGVASIMVAFETDIVPSMGLNVVVIGAVTVIVGGMHSLVGAALAGLLVAFAQHLAGWFLPSRWEDAIVFGVLIIFLLLRPHGIFESKPEKAHP